MLQIPVDLHGDAGHGDEASLCGQFILITALLYGAHSHYRNLLLWVTAPNTIQRMAAGKGVLSGYQLS